MMYVHQHTRSLSALCRHCLHVWQRVRSARKLIWALFRAAAKEASRLFSPLPFFFFNERVTCFCLTPPKPPPHREQSGPFIQALSQSAARGKRGWSVTNRSPVLHHWAPGAAREKEEKIRMKSEPSPLALSLNFSSMSQRQSDSLDALRKHSMTSPRS